MRRGRHGAGAPRDGRRGRAAVASGGKRRRAKEATESGGRAGARVRSGRPAASLAGVSERSESPAAQPRKTGPPKPVRAAAVLVAVQGALGVIFAGYLLTRAGAASLGLGAVLGEAGMFLIIGAAVLFVAWGLHRGRFWARTPAIVTQLLLLPVVYSLLVPSGQLVAGLLAGVVVLAALSLLLSAPARAWALGLDDSRRRGS
jgi:hypothetical protein